MLFLEANLIALTANSKTSKVQNYLQRKFLVGGCVQCDGIRFEEDISENNSEPVYVNEL